MLRETTLKEDKKFIIDERRKLWKQVCEFKCSEHECDFEEINPAQYRILKDNKRIDIFPVSRKFHKIHSDVRGYVGDLQDFIDQNFSESCRAFKEPKWQQEGYRKRKKKKSKKQDGKQLTMTSLMPIGKYKGTCMKDVPRAFLKYVYEHEYTSAEVMKFVKEHYDELFG